ncbi:DIM/SIM/IMP family subclass B1 metallo-beta-lactamase [Thalassotalea fonticola]|uniref:DIM/SIM/IMP family subclass B1 metallo-beta-lactamase n=1 Tax=Thalassotalea fonticola TaxID=3065649 RepID=UPI00386ACE44
MKIIFTLLLSSLAFSVFAKNQPAKLKIKEIDKDVYLHTSFKQVEGYGLVDSNGLIVIDENQAFIIDTPWSKHDTKVLINWIEKQGYELKASISTHSHDDRSAGIGILNSKSIPTFTSKLTHEFLVKDSKPTATNIFDKDEFSLKKGHIEVFYPGAGHTEDNLVVWLPKTGILFGGCLVRSLDWSSLGYIGDASVDSWSNSIASIKSKYADIKMVVPGHGKIGNKQILEHTINLADAAVNKSRDAQTP